MRLFIPPRRWPRTKKNKAKEKRHTLGVWAVIAKAPVAALCACQCPAYVVTGNTCSEWKRDLNVSWMVDRESDMLQALLPSGAEIICAHARAAINTTAGNEPTALQAPAQFSDVRGSVMADVTS